MRIVLEQGENLTIELANTDGEFVISYCDPNYDANRLQVYADLPDDEGRSDLIYSKSTVFYSKADVQHGDYHEDCEDDDHGDQSK